MAILKREDRVIRAIIKEHGATIDLRRNPELFIELVRKYSFDLANRAERPDGGTPPLPGGVPPTPSPPPGPTSRQIGPHFEDVMRELLKIQRKIAAIEKRIG